MDNIIPPQHSHRSFEEGLKFISNCPVCHHQYNPIEAKVINETETAHLLYIKCRQCHAAILALVMANQMGVSSIGVITDLDSYEVTRFEQAISGDDVLDIHESIQSGATDAWISSGRGPEQH